MHWDSYVAGVCVGVIGFTNYETVFGIIFQMRSER